MWMSIRPAWFVSGLVAVLMFALSTTPALGDSSPGFKGTFENFDPPPDSSHVTITFGGTRPDGTVFVRLLDDGGTVCIGPFGFDRFGERWPVSIQGQGVRLSATQIQLEADVICFTDSGPQVHPISPLTLEFVYDPVNDVINPFGFCAWRLGRGSEADCP